MLQVEKKIRKKAPRRLWWLLGTLMVLVLAAGIYAIAQKPAERPVTSKGYESVLLAEKTAEEVAEVSVTLSLGEGWTLRQENGAVTMADDADFLVDAAWADYILEAAAVLEAPALLADNEEEYDAHLAEFGLDEPRVTVHVRYTDETEITLRIGGAVSAEAGSWLYMTVDDQPGLYAMDMGTAEIFTTDRSILREIPQPTLHAQRFDRISLDMPGETVRWELEGAIGNSDAGERWSLTSPMTYPADAGAMETLRGHIESLRLGAWVGKATEENLALCGLDEPRLRLTVHQAAGSMGMTGVSGAYGITEWPESTFTLAVGDAKSQDVDYVLWEGDIYLTSHYSLAALTDMDWRETLSRFPVLTALGNLRRLTIEKDGALTEDIVVTRTEQVAQNNELVTDFAGQVVYDYNCTRNGAAYAYEALQSAYNRLVTVMVSGMLPEDWTAQQQPHTVYTFEDVDGTVHAVALTDFDALHDAVLVDGHAMFYLIKQGFELILE